MGMVRITDRFVTEALTAQRRVLSDCDTRSAFETGVFLGMLQERANRDDDDDEDNEDAPFDDDGAGQSGKLHHVADMVRAVCAPAYGVPETARATLVAIADEADAGGDSADDDIGSSELRNALDAERRRLTEASHAAECARALNAKLREEMDAIGRHAKVLENDIKAAESRAERLTEELAKSREFADTANRQAADERQRANNIAAQLRETVAANQAALRQLEEACTAAQLGKDDEGSLADRVRFLVMALDNRDVGAMPKCSTERKIDDEDAAEFLLEVGRSGETLVKCARRLKEQRDELCAALNAAAEGIVPPGTTWAPDFLLRSIRDALTLAKGQQDRRLAESLAEARHAAQVIVSTAESVRRPPTGAPGAKSENGSLEGALDLIAAWARKIAPQAGGPGAAAVPTKVVELPTLIADQPIVAAPNHLRVVDSWPLPWPRGRYVETLRRVRGEIDGTVRQFAARKDPDDNKWAALLTVQSQTLESLELTFGNGGRA